MLIRRAEIGGRIAFESRLPGLATWARVSDYRRIQIEKMKNVEIHVNSELLPDDVLDYSEVKVSRIRPLRGRKVG